MIVDEPVQVAKEIFEVIMDIPLEAHSERTGSRTSMCPCGTSRKRSSRDQGHSPGAHL